jgi:hypothetical protein
MSGDERGNDVPPDAGRWSAGDESSEADRRRRDRDTVIAAFATVLYVALVVCAFGFVSLLADVDVVSREGTGGLVGPAMVATSVVIVFAALVRDARGPVGPAGWNAGWSLLVGFVAAIGFVGAGVVLVAVESRRWFDGVLFASSTLTSALPWLAGALAALVAASFALVTAGRAGSRPHWPWEREDGADA